jgi:hypothetical protein
LGCSSGGSGFAAEWLVVAFRVDGQVADNLAGVDVDDGDVQVLDPNSHGAAVVLVAQADVVQSSALAQGDAPAEKRAFIVNSRSR